MEQTFAEVILKQFQEMKDWVRYSEQDRTRLQAVFSKIQPSLPMVIDKFYDEINRHHGSRRLLTNPEQIGRLKATLKDWIDEVFVGPHDEEYAKRRMAIGEMHARIGLPNRYMSLAIHLIESELNKLIIEAVDEPWPTIESLSRVLMIDLALMTGTFVHGRERILLDDLQTLLVEHLQVVVLLVDDDGNVRSATRATSNLVLGRDVTGIPWQDAIPEGLLMEGELEQLVQHSINTGRELSLPRVDMGERSFRLHIVPLRHRLARFLLQIVELTETLEMEARVRRSEALAQLGALSAAVAHELRNPLAGISGALQVITRTMEDGPHIGILRKVDKEVRRLNTLVTDLLAFSRAKPARLCKTDLRAAVQEVLDLMIPDHPDVHFKVAGEGIAIADPDLVHQILHNLLGNAVYAAKDGDVLVTIGGESITVSDSGEGVPADKKLKIFEPFVTTKTRGTGLGLAISRRSAETMAGSLTLEESGPLAGASFKLKLRAIH